MKLKQKWLCIGALLLLAVSRPERAKAQDIDDDLKVTFRNAVVKVDVSSNTPVIRGGVNVCNSVGTGFLISSSHVATAGHVVQIPPECGKPIILLKSRKHSSVQLAEVVAIKNDIALLKATQDFPAPMCALVPQNRDVYDVKGIRFGIPGQFTDPVPNSVQIGDENSDVAPLVRLNNSPAESGESGGPIVYKFNVVGVLKSKHKQYVGYSFMMVASKLRALMIENHIVKGSRICNPVELEAFYTPENATLPSGSKLRPNDELNPKAKQAVSEVISKVSSKFVATYGQIQLSSENTAENTAVLISAPDRIETTSVCTPRPLGQQSCQYLQRIVPGTGIVAAEKAATSIKDEVNDRLWEQVTDSLKGTP